MAKNNITNNRLSGQAPRPKNEETINFLDGFGFDPSWTVEQAIEADNAEGPFSPLSRWLAWAELEQQKQEFEAGNRWVTYQAPSLDDAFDVKIPEGAHLNALRKARRLRLAVSMRVKELHKQGRSIGIGLFAEVGREFGISGSSVRDYYSSKTKAYKKRRKLL